MWISTFHALCARLLRREAPHIGLSRDFVIYDSTDQLTVVKQALRELGIDDSAAAAADACRASATRRTGWRGRRPSPRALPGIRATSRSARIYALYLTALNEANALDFDDLLLKTVELFEKSETVRDRYSEKFRYVMVDEYQDTNRPQYMLIQRLAGRHRNLCVVGDPDQSIYKWRGADLRNILDFEHDFPEVRTVRLERNYRSTQVILDAASAVIAQNRNRKEKRLYTERTGGAKILYYRAGDDLDEAEFIARTAQDGAARRRARTRWRSCTAPTRSRARSRTRCGASGIAYKIIGGVRFYERKEIKDALAYLRLDPQSTRRREPAARHQRARRAASARASWSRSRRWSSTSRRRAAAAAGRPAAGRDQQLAVGEAGARDRPAAAGAARARVAHRVPRPDGRS